jgi:cytochrome c-type biogenesis protein
MSGTLSPLLAFGAGAITILSPCVLPLVPIVLASAAQRHRWGPLALAGGLVASFSIIGFAVAAFGSSIGLDSEALRPVGAVLLFGAGLLLASNAANLAVTDRLATAVAPFTNWASSQQMRVADAGLGGQAAIGALLGIVWSPCIGPTLGAATVLAAQGTNLGEVAIVMMFFALGISASLLVIAFAARGLLARSRSRMLEGGSRAKQILGLLMIIVGALILTGLDRIVEGALVAASPDWLTELTTSI